MEFKKVLLAFFAVFAIALIMFYLIFASGEIRFSQNTNPNFNIGNLSSNMQFYENMRYPSSNISYEIDNNCSLQRKNAMDNAISYVENLTILKFYKTDYNPEITISCNYKTIPAGNGAFVAGEGGTTKVIEEKNFDVILDGEVLLLRDSNCPNPNIEIHELMHALGFAHSKNPQNIMYPISDCSQTLGSDIPSKIAELYSFPSYPDLAISNVSASMEGIYLNMNLSVENEGLANSTGGNIVIFADGEKVKSIGIDELGIGEGMNIKLTNIIIPKIKTNELKVSIETNESELSLGNNNVTLSALQN